MRLRHRAFALALIGISLATSVRAEDAYPSHLVRIVLPTASGSTTDTLARLVADRLSHIWSQSVIIENIPGGAMNVGATHVARATPDGYTLMVAPPSPLTINDLLYRDLSYDPHKFVPVALLAKIPNALAVRNDLPAKTVQELIAYAKANPGKLTFGSQGVGSTAHLSGSQLEVLAGIKMVHVPYRGAVPALNDVIAGRIDMFFDTLTTSVPLWRGGKLRRRPGRRHDREPSDGAKARQSGFGKGRHSRQSGRALGAADGENLHLAGAVHRHRSRERVEEHVDMSGDHIIERRQRAAIGHVHHLDAGEHFEERRRKMRCRAHAL